jgi:uncharacterized protein (DUF924 family)
MMPPPKPKGNKNTGPHENSLVLSGIISIKLKKRGWALVEKIREILHFWFGKDPSHPEEHSERWWKKDPKFDETIRRRFGEDLHKAVRGEYEEWKNSPNGNLAWIILLDQFSRNMFRDKPEAFAQDELAREACRQGVQKGFDKKLTPIERVFFYMPLMHSEHRSDHQLSLELFQRLEQEAPREMEEALANNYHYALRHAEIIERFGRYPHRNKILGRPSTAEELEFLKQPGSSF